MTAYPFFEGGIRSLKNRIFATLFTLIFIFSLLPSCREEDAKGSIHLFPKGVPMPLERGLPAGSFRTWEVSFTMDEGEIETGSYLKFWVPFGWSKPQVDDPERDGYLTFSMDREGVTLEPLSEDDTPSDFYSQKYLLSEGEIREGDTINFIYGDGSGGGPGSMVSIQAKEGLFSLAVSSTGEYEDYSVLASSPVEVSPDEVRIIRISNPSIAYEGETIEIRLIATDRFFNPVKNFRGALTLRSATPSTLPFEEREVTFPFEGGENGGFLTLSHEVEEEGLLRISGEERGGACRVIPGPTLRVLNAEDRHIYHLWGDLHNHSFASGDAPESVAPEDLYYRLRYIAAFDFSAITDHDSTSCQFINGLSSGDYFPEIIRLTNLYNEPGEFITFLCYEWTNMDLGHKSVCFLQGEEYSEEGEDTLSFFSWCEEEKRPCDLWESLYEQDREKGSTSFTYSHHPAANSYPATTDWNYSPANCATPYPEAYETVVEISSRHGNSLRPDLSEIDDPVTCDEVDEATVHYALTEMWGYTDFAHVLGYVAGSDSHDHFAGIDPYYMKRWDNICQIAGFSEKMRYEESGLTAILVEADSREEALTRERIYQALLERNVYATTGDRININLSAVCEKTVSETDEYLMGWKGDVSECRDLSLKIKANTDRFPLFSARILHSDPAEGVWKVLESFDSIAGDFILEAEVPLIQDGYPLHNCGPDGLSRCIKEGAANIYYLIVAAEEHPPIEIDGMSDLLRIRFEGEEEWKECTLPHGGYTGEELAIALASTLDSPSCMGNYSGFTVEYGMETFNSEEPDNNMTDRVNILHSEPFEIDLSFNTRTKNLGERIGFNPSKDINPLKSRYSPERALWIFLFPGDAVQWAVQGSSHQERGYSSPLWLIYERSGDQPPLR